MNWLEESVKKSKKLKDHYMLGDVNIYVKDQLPENVDIDFVIRYVAKRLPNHVLTNIDIIYVGHFQDLVDRDINALWQNGAIYITTKEMIKKNKVIDYSVSDYILTNKVNSLDLNDYSELNLIKNLLS